MAKIGAKLGVTGPGLQKYLDGDTVPSLRTIVLAYLVYKISVPYQGVEVAKKSGVQRKQKTAPTNSCFFPLKSRRRVRSNGWR